MNTRYQIVETIAGEGGFGRIDKALDTVLERYVALKILDPLFKESPSCADKERFKREAKTLASLSHPYIPAIYDVQFPNNDQDEEFKLTQIRETLNHVAMVCHELAHQVITEKLLLFLQNLETIEAKDKEYYHDLKIFLQNLLANVHCADEYAEQLSEYFDRVNQLSR